MNDVLLAPTFLFRFSTTCLYRRTLWSAKGPTLAADFKLPSFGELEARPLFADLRAAWNQQGLAFAVRVSGKRQMPWCRAGRLEDSDGLHLWIATRETQNIHRATRFCHRFVFTPAGGGRKAEQPLGALLPIHRAREQPKEVDPDALRVRAEKRVDGYLLQAMVPAEAMTGYDPQEHARLGFSYAMVDRELGWQTFSVGPEFPFTEDPTLWGDLQLVRETRS